MSKSLKTRPTGAGGSVARIQITFEVTTFEIGFSMAYQAGLDYTTPEEALAIAEGFSKVSVLDYLKSLLRSEGEEAFQDPAIFDDDRQLQQKFIDLARRKFSREFPGEYQEKDS